MPRTAKVQSVVTVMIDALSGLVNLESAAITGNLNPRIVKARTLAVEAMAVACDAAGVPAENVQMVLDLRKTAKESEKKPETK